MPNRLKSVFQSPKSTIFAIMAACFFSENFQFFLVTLLQMLQIAFLKNQNHYLYCISLNLRVVTSPLKSSTLLQICYILLQFVTKFVTRFVTP